MRRILVAACVLFAMGTGAVALLAIERDRDETLRVVGERTASMSRMIMAHGDAAADGAMQIINSISPIVAAWDLEESSTGRTIAARFKEMADSSTLISSAWVVDARGTNIVDSWGYPAKPVTAAQRPYFKAHVAGAADPVIMGDEVPGSVTGRERFTFSSAVRNADGSLKAIVVVGIYKSIFDTLYKEAVTWPGARAGLYTITGDALASIGTSAAASPAYVQAVRRDAVEKQSGTELIAVEPEERIVSWQRSQSTSAALCDQFAANACRAGGLALTQLVHCPVRRCREHRILGSGLSRLSRGPGAPGSARRMSWQSARLATASRTRCSS